MSKSSLIRWAGIAAMLGGVLLIVSVVAVAFRPEGCIGSECDLPGKSHREWSALAPFFIAALSLIATGMVGLVTRAWTSDRFGRLGRIGQDSSLVGVALLGMGGAIQEIYFGGDFPLMPGFVIPGVLALVVGFLLLGIAILRASVLPRWAAWLLITGALAMLGFNDQNGLVLMAAPLGIAWVAAGYALYATQNKEE